MTEALVAEAILTALRQGTVPARGLEPLLAQVRAELEQVGRGQGLSKWLRGDYGAGKTFTARHIAAMARGLGFATAEVQVSANDTPLHHFEAVYRRMVERLETATAPACALPAVVDGWL